MGSRHPPAVEAYLREIDRYKAFLVGYCPETPPPDKTRGLAGKVQAWERQLASSTNTGGECRGMLLGLRNSHILPRPPMLTP